MTFHRYIFFVLCLFIVCVMGCEFDDPYVPDSAGSSTLTGRISTDPASDPTGIQILLRGNESFITITDSEGIFRFQNISPGNYSLHVQKMPYLQDSFAVTIHKSKDEDMGNLNIKLKGAIAGKIPNSDIAIIHGEVEVVVYIDDIPLVSRQNTDEDLTIELSSPEKVISVDAATKITIYIDDVPYSATMQDEGEFVVEFVPPGIYNDVRIKVNSGKNALPIVSGGPIVVKSGQTRFVASAL